MARERSITKRVNIFDGQRVTEKDLDAEQIYHNTITSDIVIDFHGSGVVNDTPFETRVLLDTRAPNSYSDTGTENSSKADIEAGSYDGHGIFLDRQPSDVIRGNRIEFQLVDAEILGRNKVKIMVLGRAFEGLDSQGELVAEFIEFFENGSQISKYYYTSIIAIIFNNFSGGTGKTENLASKDSLDLISDSGGYMIVRETEPLEVFPATIAVSQTESPNIDMINFITSDPSRSIEDEITLALGASNSISDLYIDFAGREQIFFEKDGATSISYGQKFLSEVDNLQRIDIIISVERDTEREADAQFDFSGDLVMSVHELSSDINCPTDAVPEDLIDFDPEITPLVEVSFNQSDLELLGFKLNDTPQVISFNFAGTLIADPNIEPSLKPNKFYAFLLSRRGDNRTGTIILEKGFDKVFGKTENNISLTPLETFGKQTTKYIEFDPITKRFVNDSNSSLWFKIYADTVEVTDGTAYSEFGKAITIPKTIGFIGNTEISNFKRNVSLKNVAEGTNNYVLLSQIEQFTDPGTHPRTGNFLFTRIVDGAAVSIVDSSGLDDVLEDTIPLLLARVTDKNVRDAQTITGVFDKPGLIGINTVTLIDPPANVLNANLVNRLITPDTDCNCSAVYRIADVECLVLRPGDFNDDGRYTTSDLASLMEVVGNTINSEATERSILGGEIDVLNFIRGDLDNNETIDGTDIELMEDAIDGYINFSVEQEIKVLILKLENVLESSDQPTIFTDTADTGETAASSNVVTFTTLTENQALIIRIGDLLEIESESVDAGTYKIASKTIDTDGVSVSVAVTDLNDAVITFIGATAFNVTIISGSNVNILADNNNLVNLPFASTNYEILFVESAFEPKFLDVCDLRRFIGSSFLELKEADPCECEAVECLPTNDCEPQYKNQTLIPGDLFLPNGSILAEPGVPHHGDYEYVNIKVPLPPGSIDDCSINLYDTFIKGVNGTCLTAAGYSAMKFSDGTLVGCQDSGSDTDITKGRVKFSHQVASIFVDALVDSADLDGYAEESTADSATNTVEAVNENYIDNSFTSFDTWTENVLNNTTITNISHPAGSNQLAIFDLTTSSDSGERFGRLDAPVAVQNFADDFIIDFKAARTTWSELAITNGEVGAFGTVVITNTDGGISTLKLGWKVLGNQATKMFYSGVIQNSVGAVISTFNFEIDAPDQDGEYALFRLRRIDDVVFAYYIIPDRIIETTISSFGQYIRIGTNPEVQPGSGTAEFSFEIYQNSSPTLGQIYFVRLSEVIIQSSYSSDDSLSILPLGRDDSTGEIDKATLTFPFDLTRRTNVTNAILEITPQSSGTITDSYNIIPIDILNADNLGSIYNLPLEQSPSLMVTFIPGTIISGEAISIDVTTLVISLLAQAGHLPGFIKALIIEPDATADSNFEISSTATLTITYVDESTGIVFKVGVSVDSETGIATLSTKNILYDSVIEQNRTVINFGVYLKKAGFINQDVGIGIADLRRLGIGSCSDEATYEPEEECFFIVGNTATGSYVGGPWPCQFHLP